VLPLLGTPSWEGWRDQMLALVIGLTIGTLVQLIFTPESAASPSETEPKHSKNPGATPGDPPLAERVAAGLRTPFFWRKLVFASLAYTIGVGLGAVTPKYLYFGVVLLHGGGEPRHPDAVAGVQHHRDE
jgi:hypothetical protein